jgi:hypothetical protein
MCRGGPTANVGAIVCGSNFFACRDSTLPFRVLSAGVDDPEYDAEIARLLLARRPGLQYVVVSTHDGYAALPTRFKELASALQVIPSSLTAWDGTVPTSSAAGPPASGAASAATGKGFDLVHMALWAGPTARMSGEEEAAECLTALEHCRRGGTFVALRPADSGVFGLRGRLHAQLMRRGDAEAEDPRKLEPGGTVLAKTLTGAGSPCWMECLDSQVDVSGAVGEELTPAGAKLLQELLHVDIQQLAREEPALTEQVIDDLCEMSLAGDGFAGPVLVYTPMHAIVAVCHVGEAATDAARARATATAKAEAGAEAKPASASAESGALLPAAPRGPVSAVTSTPPGAADVAELRATSAVSRASVFAPDPARLVESDAAARRAAQALLEASVAASMSGSVGDSDPLYFYLRMRGSWGNFIGTGSGDLVRAGRSAANDAYVNGGGPTVVAPKSLTGKHAATKAMMAVPHDPWFPHGLRGGFFGAGLRNWKAMRESWLSRPPNFVPPDYPPELDSEELIEELSKLQRTYTLPGPMRLPDIVDLFQDIWDEELGRGI